MTFGSSMLPRSLTDADILVRASQELALAADLPSASAILKAVVRRLARAQGVCLVLREGDLCNYIDEDAQAPLWKGQRFTAAQCISGWSISHNETAVVSDILKDPRIPQSAYCGTFVKSLAIVPLRSANPIGAIGIYWDRVHDPEAQLLENIQALADVAARHFMKGAQLAAVSELTTKTPTPGADYVRMCPWTKRFFHDQEWLSMEGFLKKRFGVNITHGISDDALDCVMKDLEKVD